MTIDPAFDDRIAQLILQSQVMWGVAAATLLLLVLFAWRCHGRPAASELPGNASLREHLRSFHDSSSAIASMEFLMVLLPFLIIVLVVWQLAFMFNAQIHVGYSAYAAARSASVVIPADMGPGKERPGLLRRLEHKDAEKWRSIRRAAIPGLIAISPGNKEDALLVVATLRGTELMKDFIGEGNIGRLELGGLPDAAALLPRLSLMTMHQGANWIAEGSRFERGVVKSMYADNVTQVLINGRDHRQTRNFSGADTIEVTVKYVFWLNVPFAGRMIEATMQGWINPLTDKPFFRNPYPTMELSETIHMKVWHRKRTVEPC